MNASTLAATLDAATAALRSASPTPRLDAEVLVHHVCGATRADRILYPQRVLSDAQQSALAALIERRVNGEPIAYLTGRREFWSLEIEVSPATLIPRPETELLVERALARLPLDGVAGVVDLGTGSGAIALAIAYERPQLQVVATERSAAALAVARANAERLGLTNVELHQGDWFAPLAGRRFDVIVSNPPYVRADDPHLSQGDVRFEPREALVAGADGLEAIRQIAEAARTHLEPGGWVLLEHGYDQAAAARALFRRQRYHPIVSYRDLARHERVTEARLA